jgi:hypothetical protein
MVRAEKPDARNFSLRLGGRAPDEREPRRHRPEKDAPIHHWMISSV